MSFNNEYLCRISSSANERAGVFWSYKTSEDTMATVATDGYFNDGQVGLAAGKGKFSVGDMIYIVSTDHATMVLIYDITTSDVKVTYLQAGAYIDGLIVNADVADYSIVASTKLTQTADGAIALGDVVNVIPTVLSTESYRHYFSVDDGVAFNDTASGKITATDATKTYLVNIEGGRPVGEGMTGDSNDAAIKADYHNFAANDGSSIIRGINVTVRNRGADATVGLIEGAQIGAQSKTSATAATIRGMSVIPENYSTCGTEFGGIDVVLKNETNTATTSYGLRIRNIEASSQAAVNQGILFSNTSTNGFLYGIDMNGCDMATADIRLQNGATIDNTAADTLTVTETNIDLVGALAADAVTVSDVLTFSDGATIDNSDATTLTLTETNIELTGILTVSGATTLSSPLGFSLTTAADTSMTPISLSYNYLGATNTGTDTDNYGFRSTITQTSSNAQTLGLRGYIMGVRSDVHVDGYVDDAYSLYAKMYVDGASSVNQLYGLNAVIATGSDTIAMDESGNIAGIGVSMNGTGDITSAGTGWGRLSGMYINWNETNAMTVDTCGIYLGVQVGATLDSALRINASGTLINTLHSHNTGGTITNLIKVVANHGVFADFDDATGNIAVESGSEATSFKFRIKVVSPDGTDCWVNAWSTSNA